jgi:hypothetical protein
MAENDGLDDDKESHPGLLMLTEQLVTYSRVCETTVLTAHGK